MEVVGGVGGEGAGGYREGDGRGDEDCACKWGGEREWRDGGVRMEYVRDEGEGEVTAAGIAADDYLIGGE